MGRTMGTMGPLAKVAIVGQASFGLAVLIVWGVGMVVGWPWGVELATFVVGVVAALGAAWTWATAD